jgi:hypothetical protein
MVFDICAKHGIGEAAFYNRKSKYGGMNLNELKRLKAHEPNFVVLLVSLFLSEITLSELKFGVAISQNIVHLRFSSKKQTRRNTGARRVYHPNIQFFSV